MINGVLEDLEIKTMINYFKNKFEAFNYEYENWKDRKLNQIKKIDWTERKSPYRR